MFYTAKKEIKVNGNKVVLNILHQSEGKIPETGEEFEGQPGKINQPVEYFKDGVRKTDEEIVAAGLAENHKGFYYDFEGNYQVVKKLNEKPRKSWRKTKPLPYEKWNGESYEVDEKKKEEYESLVNSTEELNDLNKQMVKNLNVLNSTDHEVFKLAEKIVKDQNKELVEKREVARKEVLTLRGKIKKKKSELDKM